MRIRKHAKISPLVYATSSLKPGTLLQPHVCQLNQSPWDVMTFSPPSTLPPPPPPSQADGVDDCVENGSSGHGISVVEREFQNCGYIKEEVKSDQIILCCKTDGKSWQCRREAAKGSSLCEHHLSLVKNYQNLAHHSSKKSDKSVETRRRTRLKKGPSSSNPYEFYYYSGFGPRWGKKRGETYKNNGYNVPRSDFEHKHEIGLADTSEVDEEELDSGEDENGDGEAEENQGSGKKRVRKPVKARSLKSLM